MYTLKLHLLKLFHKYMTSMYLFPLSSNHMDEIHYLYVLLIFQMDLTTFINKKECECLNESDEHPFGDALSAKDGYLESDCDEQVSEG